MELALEPIRCIVERVPRLIRRTLFSADDLQLCRVVCDGIDGPRPVDEHMDGDRLIVVLRGRFSFRDHDTATVASPSTALCLGDGHAFQIAHTHDCDGDICLSVQGTIAHTLRDAGATSRPISPRAYLRLHALVAELGTGLTPTRLTLEEACCDALAPQAPARQSARPRDTALAERVTHRLARDVDRHVSLHELAAGEQVSIFHLCHVFKQVTGTTIHQHQQELRLRHAVALLLETDDTLAEMALTLGFSSQSHFTNVFRRRFRTTPGQVRRLGPACLDSPALDAGGR